MTNFKIHQNLFKYWFALLHFAMDDPVLHTWTYPFHGESCNVLPKWRKLFLEEFQHDSLHRWTSPEYLDWIRLWPLNKPIPFVPENIKKKWNKKYQSESSPFRKNKAKFHLETNFWKYFKYYIGMYYNFQCRKWSWSTR